MFLQAKKRFVLSLSEILHSIRVKSKIKSTESIECLQILLSCLFYFVLCASCYPGVPLLSLCLCSCFLSRFLSPIIWPHSVCFSLYHFRASVFADKPFQLQASCLCVCAYACVCHSHQSSSGEANWTQKASSLGSYSINIIQFHHYKTWNAYYLAAAGGVWRQWHFDRGSDGTKLHVHCPNRTQCEMDNLG